MSIGNRNFLILDFFDRKDKLEVKNKDYKSNILDFFIRSVKNDKGIRDETSVSIFNKNKQICAELVCKEKGFFCGRDEVRLFLDYFKLEYRIYKKDGEKILNGDKLLKIFGNARDILLIERTLINVIARMSGIATKTQKFVTCAKDKVKILGTRKTIWNLLDKKAISIGGGLTHRLNLSDGILIKDNHLAATNNNIEFVLSNCSKNKNIDFIEIEVNSTEKALRSVKKILDLNNEKKYAIMFDNMEPERIKKTIKKINKLVKINNKSILFEASGGIDYNNILAYTNIGVDAVSFGCLTHSVKSLDFSLKVK